MQTGAPPASQPAPSQQQQWWSPSFPATPFFLPSSTTNPYMINPNLMNVNLIHAHALAQAQAHAQAQAQAQAQALEPHAVATLAALASTASSGAAGLPSTSGVSTSMLHSGVVTPKPSNRPRPIIGSNVKANSPKSPPSASVPVVASSQPFTDKPKQERSPKVVSSSTGMFALAQACDALAPTSSASSSSSASTLAIEATRSRTSDDDQEGDAPPMTGRPPACNNCRRSKVKCEGSIPCSRCTRLCWQDSCVREYPRKRGRKRKVPAYFAGAHARGNPLADTFSLQLSASGQPYGLLNVNAMPLSGLSSYGHMNVNPMGLAMPHNMSQMPSSMSFVPFNTSMMSHPYAHIPAAVSAPNGSTSPLVTKQPVLEPALEPIKPPKKVCTEVPMHSITPSKPVDTARPVAAPSTSTSSSASTSAVTITTSSISSFVDAPLPIVLSSLRQKYTKVTESLQAASTDLRHLEEMCHQRRSEVARLTHEAQTLQKHIDSMLEMQEKLMPVSSAPATQSSTTSQPTPITNSSSLSSSAASLTASSTTTSSSASTTLSSAAAVDVAASTNASVPVSSSNATICPASVSAPMEDDTDSMRSADSPTLSSVNHLVHADSSSVAPSSCASAALDARASDLPRTTSPVC